MYPAYMGYLNWCYQIVISGMLSDFIKPILKEEYHGMSMPSMLSAILFLKGKTQFDYLGRIFIYIM